MITLKKFLSVILSFIFLFPSYLFSFLPSKADTDFTIEGIATVSVSGIENGIISKKAEFDFGDADCGWFNYYGISYKSDAYMKGVITYMLKGEQYSEEFFLEPSDGTKPFYSFIDGILDKTKSNILCNIMLEPLDKDTAVFELIGVDVFNREVPDKNVYLQNSEYKIGVNLLWGGALDYLEDLDSDVQAVLVDGITKVDSNASERYGVRSVNNKVNLINRHDTGRLVQQSYYGTFDCDAYQSAMYGEHKWNYNPVQGGNQYNESSKIVDLTVGDDYIYIKCRPLDWAKPAEDISPSYMEATYSICDGAVEVSCRFVDFSGYPEYYTTQELPAFYCIEPFNRFVYYNGDAPWTGDKNYSYQNELIFWPDAGYPNFQTTENWSAFIGEFDDSFGIGIYTPHHGNFLAGVLARETTTDKDPSLAPTTSYIATVKHNTFRSFVPSEYNYYIATGTVDEMRESFDNLR